MHPADRTRGASTVDGVLSPHERLIGAFSTSDVFEAIGDASEGATDKRRNQAVVDVLDDDDEAARFFAHPASQVILRVEQPAVRRCEQVLDIGHPALSSFDEIVFRGHLMRPFASAAGRAGGRTGDTGCGAGPR